MEKESNVSEFHEDHFFFEKNGRRLYGFLHQAAETAGSPSIGVVFLDPWGEEKVRNHRLLVNLARHLARNGIHALRFDFYGYGDSAGSFQDATPETMIADTMAAMDMFRNKVGLDRIGLLGPRFGGAIAALTACRGTSVDFLILFDPVVDAYAYFYKLLRSNLTSQLLVHQKVLRDRNQLVEDLRNGTAVNIDGYLLSPDFFRQAEKINLRQLAPEVYPPTLLVAVSTRESGRDQSVSKFKTEHLPDRDDITQVALDFPLFWEGQKIYHPHPGPLQDYLPTWIDQVIAKITDIESVQHA